MSSKESGRTLTVDSGERSEQRTAKGSKQVRGSSGTRGQRSLSLPSWPPGIFPQQGKDWTWAASGTRDRAGAWMAGWEHPLSAQQLTTFAHLKEFHPNLWGGNALKK